MSALFLGFPVDPLFAKQLQKVDPVLIKNFIGQKDFLQKREFEGMEFLGKEIKTLETLAGVSLVEEHIISLLSRLVPDFPYSETPLYIFPLADE